MEAHITVNKYNSMVFRLTGIIFLLFAATIGTLLFLVNYQMDTHFSNYLYTHAMGGMPMGMHGMMMHNSPENIYLSSVHQSLFWVGSVMICISVFVSWLFVRSFVKPLRKLTDAVHDIAEGSFGQTVRVDRNDEVGMLADTFNDMSRKLEYNDTMRRQLFASIAHELRTPLAIMQGNLEGMIDDVIPADKEHFLSMEDEILRLNRLVQDLRDLSLAEVNELVLHKSDVELNLLLTRAAGMLQPLFDEKNLHVTVHLDDAVPLLQLDKDRTNQVIYNILNNAIRYTPEAADITITTCLEEAAGKRQVRLQIADTGPGIEKEDLEHIFECFYRAEKSRNRKSGGSGIGLALARQFVLSQGGTIQAASEVGKGTVFTITFPAA